MFLPRKIRTNYLPVAINLLLTLFLLPFLSGVVPLSGTKTDSFCLSYADWPMAGGNPQRTSWVSEEVSGSLKPVWYRPIEPYIGQNIQIVAAEGKLFISTARGLYTLNATTGDVAWIYATEMPLGHSPTYDNGVLYVGGLDKRLHAVDATNGTRLWTFDEAKAGYRTNPLVVENLVLLGNSDGWFYAIHKHGAPGQGTLAWKFQTGGPVDYSAAYKDGVLYFGSMDMYAYALNASNGTPVWTSQKMHGTGFQTFWPVIWEKHNKIVFTTTPNYRTGMSPGFTSCGIVHGKGQWPDAMDSELVNGIERDEIWPNEQQEGVLIGPEGNEPGDWAQGTQTIDARKAMEYYGKKPWRRSRYFLEIFTGADWSFDYDGDGGRDFPPTLCLGTKNGIPTPPMVSGYDNVLYIPNVFKHAIWICRGGISGWKYGTPFISYIAEGAVDEPRIASGGGRVIYKTICCDREASIIDISRNNRGSKLYNYDLDSKCPGYDEMWVSMEWMSRLRGYYGTGNGIYHSHTNAQNPWIPCNGRIYTHRSNCILCFGPEGGAKKLSHVQTQTPSKESLPTPTMAELTQKLAEEIQKWVDAGHLHPGWINGGQISVEYFESSAANIWVLLRALPHLSPDLQTKVKSFIQTENQQFPLLYNTHIGWQTGVTRDWFVYPPEVIADFPNYGPHSAGYSHYHGYWQLPMMNYYVLWQYAKAFGSAGTVYDSIQGKLDNYPIPGDQEARENPQGLNAIIAGHWAYLEIEKLAGHSEDQSVRNALNTLLNLRINTFSKDTPFDLGEVHKNVFNVSRNWINMTPELGQYLHDHILAKVQAAMDEYNFVAPYWPLPRYEGSLCETDQQILFDYWAMFTAKAWILKEGPEELAKYLHAPGFMRGDLFYLHNLISLIEAGEPHFVGPFYLNLAYDQVFHDKLRYIYDPASQVSIQCLRKPNWVQVLGDSIIGKAPSTIGTVDTMVSMLFINNQPVDTMVTVITVVDPTLANPLLPRLTSTNALSITGVRAGHRSVRFDIMTNRQTPLLLSVYNTTGQRVWLYRTQRPVANRTTIVWNWNRGLMANSTYLSVLRQNSRTARRRFAVIR